MLLGLFGGRFREHACLGSGHRLFRDTPHRVQARRLPHWGQQGQRLLLLRSNPSHGPGKSDMRRSHAGNVVPLASVIGVAVYAETGMTKAAPQ